MWWCIFFTEEEKFFFHKKNNIFREVLTNKVVGLKYVDSIFVKSVKSENGVITSIHAEVDKEVIINLFRNVNLSLI